MVQATNSMEQNSSYEADGCQDVRYVAATAL
jgi:hypothetical protein